jgi:hypothetical protein
MSDPSKISGYVQGRYERLKEQNELPVMTFMPEEAKGHDPMVTKVEKSFKLLKMEEKMAEDKPKEENEKVIDKTEEKPEEDEKCNSKKAVEEMEDDSEEEDSEEEKKKKKKKAKKDVGGESPSEEASASNSGENTMSPGADVPSKPQDVFVPQSSVNVAREQMTPMGKSVEPDLLKSPLFVNLSSQIEGIRDAVSKKVEALEKSVNDRLTNVQKDMAKIEKFYGQSFYKAINENVAPESTQAQGIAKQLADGKIRFSSN